MVQPWDLWSQGVLEEIHKNTTTYFNYIYTLIPPTYSQALISTDNWNSHISSKTFLFVTDGQHCRVTTSQKSENSWIWGASNWAVWNTIPTRKIEMSWEKKQRISRARGTGFLLQDSISFIKRKSLFTLALQKSSKSFEKAVQGKFITNDQKSRS